MSPSFAFNVSKEGNISTALAGEKNGDFVCVVVAHQSSDERESSAPLTMVHNANTTEIAQDGRCISVDGFMLCETETCAGNGTIDSNATVEADDDAAEDDGLHLDESLASVPMAVHIDAPCIGSAELTGDTAITSPTLATTHVMAQSDIVVVYEPPCDSQKNPNQKDDTTNTSITETESSDGEKNGIPRLIYIRTGKSSVASLPTTMDQRGLAAFGRRLFGRKASKIDEDHEEYYQQTLVVL